jgi:hypothetical protein
MGWWKLSAMETAGVVAVGLASTWAVDKAAGAVAPNMRPVALLAGGAAVYTAGVVIGANRPPGGWKFPPLQLTGPTQ